ncbi:MAG TPA: 16S rRNA (cytosine(1402)-N(4))-methyltransferase [Anaerolineaceae bacterium]|nr:16S rRNA (cytosine(1402)-N(4))-methyltransferase [Anaerolineaceae bacterium]
MQQNQVFPHVPVLSREVLAYLNPTSGGRYVDATLGAGGHAEAILKASQPDGLLIGLDVDENALAIAAQRLANFSSRFFFFHSSYTHLDSPLKQLGWEGMDAILFDLGVSSMQVDSPERGFSFHAEGPLDMRFNGKDALTASDIVNGWEEHDLATILWEYGEEPKARAIAKAICAARPLKTTTELARVVLSVYHGQHGRIHPATRTFQAIRIAVNEELTTVSNGISKAVEYLFPGGKIAVISFHSLEDRIVKEFFRRESKDCICPPEQPTCNCGHKASLTILTKKPIMACEDEIKINPRSRSAKMRVAQKIG